MGGGISIFFRIFCIFGRLWLILGLLARSFPSRTEKQLFIHVLGLERKQRIFSAEAEQE